jgi:hypothetical protein
MPARDTIHDAVKNALMKDGWTIVADPYLLRYEDKSLVADLRAEKSSWRVGKQKRLLWK